MTQPYSQRLICSYLGLKAVASFAGFALVLGLLFAAPASATYEQIATFPGVNSSVNGLAVNVAGAGGVDPGTLYEASGSQAIRRYNAKGEFLGALKTQGSQAIGVAVDQTTGNVYALNQAASGETGLVQVFSADGSQLIASFGEAGASHETIDEGPEKIHSVWGSGIAVDDSGVVYVSDIENGSLKFESRVMVFEPQSPGDYEHYIYAGRSHDIAATHEGVNYGPRALSLDTAGNLYTEANTKAIYEFAPGEPTPICEYQLPTGGITGMTVNPESGEVFYFTYKDGKIHQLAPCNAQGKFVETTSFALTPKTEETVALAFNPALAWEPSRPAGVLYAARQAGGIEQGLGYIFAPAEVRDPVIESESVSSVATSTATLRAQINPKGSPTRYAFQYITDAVYRENEPAERYVGATEAPLGGAALGTGQVPLGAGVGLVGLAPDTEYHYRVIATSHCDPDNEAKLCEAIGPDQSFRTFPAQAPGLPDDRAWELVSPVQKNGGEVIPAYPFAGSCYDCKPAWIQGDHYPMQSTPDGEAVVYEGLPFSTTEGAPQFNQYISRRTGSGWQTTILSPALINRRAYKGFNAELTHGVIAQDSPTLSPEAPPGFANLYSQDTANPSALSPLIRAEPPNRNPQLTYAGASADFSRLFFEADDALTEETSLAPAAVDGGTEMNNLYESVGGQLRLVNVLPGNTETAPGAAFGSGEVFNSDKNTKHSDFSHAISEDGSRVFWSDEAGQVYVRENGESTTAIPDPGEFLTASADGSKALLSNGHLYDLQAEATVDLTEGQGGFEGIIGQSEDLSHVYFVDTAVLSGEEENDHGAKAQGGKFNLYAWHEGVIVFVATLVPNDNIITFGFGGDWNASPARRTAEASPNGRWVAFPSRAPLTGYDAGLCTGFTNGTPHSFPCNEVFLYDSVSGELSCPSCNPTGEGPPGELYPLRYSSLGVIQQADSAFAQPRYLTDSGRLYFDSQDSLSPFDTNNGVEDVYQYEPQGVGTCKREGGCVSLISAGHEPVDSNFLAADATGKNVFFTSRDQLVIKDRDDLIDLYVARADGGIPAETETARPECQGESCQPAAIVPNDPTPASSSFQGAGNVVEKKAKKAKAHHKKRKQRAKKRRHRQAHRRAASHNRGGAK